mmetsp:Transcript_2501/g.6958  ORF Transcript_2501/g.6958 Transcript_2501/m.6958 type:complete len:94 (+) Transcript_2501:539-820(+)
MPPPTQYVALSFPAHFATASQVSSNSLAVHTPLLSFLLSDIGGSHHMPSPLRAFPINDHTCMRKGMLARDAHKHTIAPDSSSWRGGSFEPGCT